MSNEEENATLFRFIDNFKCKQNHDHVQCKRKLPNEDNGNEPTPEKKYRLNVPNDTEFISPFKSHRSRLTEDSRANATISSPWESRRLKSELADARSQILMLESQVQQLHAVRKELEIVFENEKTALQNVHKRDRHLITELESRLSLIREREAETRAELTELRHKFESNKIKYEKRMESMLQQIDKLKEDVMEASNAGQEDLSMASQRILDLEDALSTAEDEVEVQKQRIEQLESQLSGASETQRDIEVKEQVLQNALLKIKELEYEIASHDEWKKQSAFQQKKIIEYSKFEKEVTTLREENRYLRDAIQNKLLLEEQVLDLQKNLEMNQNLQKEIADFEVKYSYLEKKLNGWNTFAREVADITEPDCNLQQKLKEIFQSYQQKEVILTSEKSTLENELRTYQRDLNNKKQEIDKSNGCIAELQNLTKNHQNLIHRLQKKLLLVSRERDSYRAQLDSYEKELTINPELGTGFATDDITRNRLETCERLIIDYRELITKLENDFEVATNQNQSLVPIRAEQMKRLQAEVIQLRAENEKILKKRSELEKELEHHALEMNTDTVKILQEELTQLRSNLSTITNQNGMLLKEIDILKKSIPKKEKILSMSLNPFAEASAQHDANVATLTVEIDRLKRKVRNLEEGFECSTTENIVQPTQEIINLKKQIESYELKVSRLKQVFKETSQNFKDACYMLLGFKIDKVSNSNYRLLSMYADSPEDYLSFDVTEDVTLLETPFSLAYDDLIELHLRQHQSIPLFLASITEQLFSRHTLRMQSTTIST